MEFGQASTEHRNFKFTPIPLGPCLASGCPKTHFRGEQKAHGLPQVWTFGPSNRVLKLLRVELHIGSFQVWSTHVGNLKMYAIGTHWSGRLCYLMWLATRAFAPTDNKLNSTERGNDKWVVNDRSFLKNRWVSLVDD